MFLHSLYPQKKNIYKRENDFFWGGSCSRDTFATCTANGHSSSLLIKKAGKLEIRIILQDLVSGYELKKIS